MAHDENVYVNPGNFDPTRFLPKPSGNGEPHLNAVFGFGRRSVIHVYKLQTLDHAFYLGSVLECTWPMAVSGLRLRRY